MKKAKEPWNQNDHPNDKLQSEQPYKNALQFLQTESHEWITVYTRTNCG